MRIVVLCVALVGCATTGAAVQQQEPLPVPPNPPTCTDRRTDDKVLTVECRAYGEDPDYETMLRLKFLRAAQGTIAAGKTHFIQMSSDTDFQHRRNVTPGRCETSANGASLAAHALSVFAAGVAPRQVNCRPGFAGQVICDLPPPPPPIAPVQYQTTCSQDSVRAKLTGVVHTATYELLTDVDAAARYSPDLPPDKFPFEARYVISKTNVPPPGAPAPRAAETPAAPVRDPNVVYCGDPGAPC